MGLIGGLFGVGAGVLMIPALQNIWGVHKDDARAMSLAILCPPVTLGAVIEYGRRGDVRWWMVLLQFSTYMMSNRFGAVGLCSSHARSLSLRVPHRSPLSSGTISGNKVDKVLFNDIFGGLLAALGVTMFVLAGLDCGGWCIK